MRNTITVFFKYKTFFIKIINTAYLIIVFTFNIYDTEVMEILMNKITVILMKTKMSYDHVRYMDEMKSLKMLETYGF